MPPSPGDQVPSWLKSLPMAPEFHPTVAEFAEPVAYILKIEPAAAPFGICKVVPPHPPPPKRTTLANLTRSFAALHPDDPSPTFPTRHQQLGLCPRRPRPAIKPVWLSSHRYTLPQFEAKAGATRKALLSHLNVPASRQLSTLDVEALFWSAMADRPVTVEYASDMPGSGFAPCADRRRHPPAAAAQVNVGDTAWNMRDVARSPGSLLRFLREEVPGVTSPMLYVAMMFSWFAWHVEDHDLHSVNYMHSGAPKTWYGVPGDAALAFEDVVRVHGYGGEVNALETFAMLGNKTTVMSPEVLVESGIPCCRLVQNTGEFVVTFPGAYHSGFSHGFNCGEASNIATPEWLRVAKEAAVRRASINRPPMVSHYQLLYELAMSMCLRDMPCEAMEPRSSRLKEKKKCDEEQLLKRIFVRNVIEDNKLLSHFVNDGSSCVILPTNAHDGSVQSNLISKSQSITESRLLGSMCTDKEDSGSLPLTGALDKNDQSSVCPEKKYPPTTCMHDCVKKSSSSEAHNADSDMRDVISAAGLLDQGLLSCVTCGILSFSCVAVIKPREPAATFFMSADSSLIDNQLKGAGNNGGILPSLNRSSALDLLASAYGGHSDSYEDVPNKLLQVSNDSNKLLSSRAESQSNSLNNGDSNVIKVSSSSKECQQGLSSQSTQCMNRPNIPSGPKGVRTRNKYQLKLMLSEGFPKDIYSASQKKVQCEPPNSNNTSTEQIHGTKYNASHNSAAFSIDECKPPSSNNISFQPIHGTNYDATHNSTAFSVDGNTSSTTRMNDLVTPIVKPDKDSSRMHVFCLEHAADVEKQLLAIGGAHTILLCRPEYPKIEAEARLLAEEMKVDYDWKDIRFRDASMEDREKIQEVVRDEETIPTNNDWAVKMGINLYYSANLAKSPLYNKQLPYNRVIYKAFDCDSPDNAPVKLKTYARRQSRPKKVVLAGRWCGKVWMSNQVHPFLAQRTESHMQEEMYATCSYHLDQKTKGEPVNDSSREAVSTEKRTVEEKTSKRQQEPLEKPNTKKPKFNEEDSSKALESAAEVSTRSSSRIAVEKANTKKPEHTEEDNPKALKGATEATTGVALRSSTRIANRKNKIKSKMEEDNVPASPLKSIIKEDNDYPVRNLRARSPDPNTKVGMKKQLKETRGQKQRTPSSTGLKDKEQPSDANGCAMSFDTKHQLSVCKKKTKVASKQETKKGKRRAPSAPEHVEDYKCDIEGCSMSFGTKQELSLHLRDICPVKGCQKKFFSHKYLLQHRKVHADDRPLKCTWKGCNMAFKWQWARTEHLRVHTGDRPYVCREPGCEQTFRFVSDFSRHKRRTGHLGKKAKKK